MLGRGGGVGVGGGWNAIEFKSMYQEIMPGFVHSLLDLLKTDF